MIDFFLSLNCFAQALLVVFIVGLFAVAMIALTGWISNFAAEALSAVSPSMMSPLGALFGLTAAFLGLTVAQNHADAVSAANKEARSLSEAWIIAQDLPAPLRGRVQSDIQAYINAVVKDEWPTLTFIRSADNPVSERTEAYLVDAESAVVDAGAASPSTVLAATGSALRDASAARSRRIDVAVRVINIVELCASLLLGLLLVALVAIVHHANRAAQIIGVTLVSFAVAVVIGAIAMQDDPFGGHFAVSAADFARAASYSTKFVAGLPN